MSCVCCYFCFSTTDSGAGKCETSSEVLHFPCVSWTRSRGSMASLFRRSSSRLFRLAPAFSRAISVLLRCLFGFRGPVLVPCFRFGLVAFPSPSVGFPFGPFWPGVFSLSPAVLLHLASFLFRVGKQHCRKPGCNDPGPCRPSIWTVTPDPSPAGSRRGDGPVGRPAG